MLLLRGWGGGQSLTPVAPSEVWFGVPDGVVDKYVSAMRRVSDRGDSVGLLDGHEGEQVSGLTSCWKVGGLSCFEGHDADRRESVRS